MAEAYTIRVLLPDGDSEGLKIVDLPNGTSVAVAFPRSEWLRASKRPEFTRSGVYILIGDSEGAIAEETTIYVGQGDAVSSRIESHDANRAFWSWGIAFVSKADPLNSAHTRWLEYALLERARSGGRCKLDNSTEPKEPKLSESDRADVNGFLREIYRILPILGVHEFDAAPGERIDKRTAASPVLPKNDARDTIIVPAREEGFAKVFLGENSWYYIRIGGGMLPKIKYIAAYQSAPISAITHYAPVERIEPYGDGRKFRVIFAESAKPLKEPIPFAGAAAGSMQGIRYTQLSKLLTAKHVTELFDKADS